jgi:uncharacterized protein with FMN-binding domain
VSTRRVLFALAGSAAGALLLIGTKGSQAGPVLPRRPADLGTVTSAGRPAPGTYDVTGPVVSTPFGPVQVRVSIVGTRIADVVAVRVPDEHGLSQELSRYATPTLRRETLTAQSARIDVVSGATYTSDAYAQSLQAALNKAANSP